MNYMYGSVQSHNNNNQQQNSAHYGYLIPVQVPERRVYNPQMIDQRHYVQQVVPSYSQYPQQYQQISNSSSRRNPSISRSLAQSTPIILNNATSSQYIMPSSSLIRTSNLPTFNSHVLVDYKRMFNGSNPTTNESGSRHAPISHMPSTFAMASNSILKRSDMNNPLTSSLADFPNYPLLNRNQNQGQGSKNYDYHSQNQNQRNSVSQSQTLPSIQNSPTKSDRNAERTRTGLYENHQGYYRNQANYSDRLDTVEELSDRRSYNPERRAENPNRHIIMIQQQRSSQNLNRQDPYAHLSNANRHEEIPAYRHDLRPSTVNNVLLRPATIRITIASPHLTNMGLRGLRSNFDSDDTFTDEVFRINDFINQMFGRSDGQTNFVSAFLQQFLNQLEDNNAKPVGITEDALAKLKTKKFKKKKSKKNKSKKTDDESTAGEENVCAICLVDYEEGDEQCFLGCEHNFHKDCITAWLKKKAECPTCRHQIE